MHPTPPPVHRARLARRALAMLVFLAATAGGIAFADPSSSPATTTRGALAGRPTAALLNATPGALRSLRRSWQPLPRASVASVPIAAQARHTADYPGTPCGLADELLCTTVPVPLDRSGVVSGKIPLKVQILPSLGPQRGVVFLIAGGPGQGSAHVFGLEDPGTVFLYDYLFPGYTVVAVDNRGTGESGLLNCPGLQAGYELDAELALVSGCAGQIGPNRVFFSTREHAEDLEAVRQAIGADKVALFGISYGTKLSLAYALAHPDRVERLLLDSVVPTDLDDPYRSVTARELPKALAQYCAGSTCRAATSDFVGDVVAVANRLGGTPIRVPVKRANGTTKNVRVSGVELISDLVEADLNGGLAATLPSIVHAARGGNLKPLGRITDLVLAVQSTEAIDLSFGLFAATICNDGPLPWAAGTPVAERPATLQAAVAALPSGTFGSFGNWAYQVGNASFCLGWPEPSGQVALAAGPLPNVPVLAVAGGIDMRTPAASAAAVAAKFPQGKLVVVPAVGHSVITADPTFCAAQITRLWILDRSFETSCPRAPSLAPVVPSPPKGGRSAGATFASAKATLAEAEAVWLASGGAIAGPAGGRLVPGQGGFKLDGYSVTSGVELDGTVDFVGYGPPARFQGLVTVSGARAASGYLRVDGTSVSGALAGRPVS